MKELNLEESPIFTSEEIKELDNKKTFVGYGHGEGKEHKAMKEYIASDPKSIGISGKVVFVDNEYGLKSGDSLDVFLYSKRWYKICN